MNRFFTILFIPEKNDKVKKFRIPTIHLRTIAVLAIVGVFFTFFMIYDYVLVMQQLSDSRQLSMENRLLREEIQIFSNKIKTLEQSLKRIETFTTKLRIITNQVGENKDSLKEKVDKKIPGIPMDDHSITPGTTYKHKQEQLIIYQQRRSLLSFSPSPYPLQLSLAPKKRWRQMEGGPALYSQEKKDWEKRQKTGKRTHR